MRSPLLPLLLLAACSSDPVAPTDSGPADSGWPWLDAGTPADDRAALPDFGPRDTGVLDAGADVDVWMVEEDPPPDRPTPVDVVDVPAVVDAGMDVVATEDVPDVQLVDVGTDRPEVAAADVPRDAGPVDGGPVVYDLEVARAGVEAHFAGRRTSPAGSVLDCLGAATASACAVVSGVLSFSARSCGNDLTGRFVLGDAGVSTLSISSGGGGSFARVLRFATGSRVGGRRSLHVQFSAPPFQGEDGFGGIPGRTVDPALADLWLLGCASD